MTYTVVFFLCLNFRKANITKCKFSIFCTWAGIGYRELISSIEVCTIQIEEEVIAHLCMCYRGIGGSTSCRDFMYKFIGKRSCTPFWNHHYVEFISSATYPYNIRFFEITSKFFFGKHLYALKCVV